MFEEDPEYFQLSIKQNSYTTIVCSQPYPNEVGWEKIPNKTLGKIL